VHWIALHARTVEQHYAGEARWDAIAELKRAVDAIPVLGNGDIWEASDAVEMMAATGCDGVVIGRGCLGRPWLFGDLVTVLNGGGAPPPRALGIALDAIRRHARLLTEHYEPHGGERFAMRDFRKHTNWYMSGYPVGPEVRRRLSQISSLHELDGILDELDPTTEMVAGGERIKRGHSNGPIKVSLPEHFLDDRDDLVIPDDNDVMALSGG
jgi:tRNA-dihydrouridine synthase